MTPVAGGVALNLALGCSVLSIITLIAYNRTLDHRLFLAGQRLGLAISFFVFISVCVCVCVCMCLYLCICVCVCMCLVSRASHAGGR